MVERGALSETLAGRSRPDGAPGSRRAQPSTTTTLLSPQHASDRPSCSRQALSVPSSHILSYWSVCIVVWTAPDLGAEIWASLGGWWAGQVNWKRNTAIVGVGYTAFVFYVLWPYSAKHEVRLPRRARPRSPWLARERPRRTKR